MGFSYIQVRERSLIYKGKIYDYVDFLKNSTFPRKRFLVILDENLYINKVNIKEEKRANEQTVSKIIKESFGNCDDFLFNYEIMNDKQTLYIYGIKGGIKVARLCKGARDVKVIPVQIWVADKLKDKIKEKSWQCIFKYQKVYYFFSILEDFIEVAFAQEDINLFNNKFQKLVNKEVLFLDNTINELDIKGMENFKYIEVGGILNENTFSK